MSSKDIYLLEEEYKKIAKENWLLNQFFILIY
jgi:hypothetical protein